VPHREVLQLSQKEPVGGVVKAGFFIFAIDFKKVVVGDFPKRYFPVLVCV